MQVPKRHSYPPELRGRRAKRARRDRSSDGTSTNAEERSNHEVTGRPINKRTNLDLSDMEIIPAMFNRLTWFIKKEPKQPVTSKASEPKSGLASKANHPASRPANQTTPGRGQTNAGASRPNATPQTATTSTQSKISDRGRKHARKTDADETQPGPIVVQPAPSSPAPAPAANSVHGRKILVPTRFSERLKQKAAAGKA